MTYESMSTTGPPHSWTAPAVELPLADQTLPCGRQLSTPAYGGLHCVRDVASQHKMGTSASRNPQVLPMASFSNTQPPNESPRTGVSENRAPGVGLPGNQSSSTNRGSMNSVRSGGQRGESGIVYSGNSDINNTGTRGAQEQTREGLSKSSSAVLQTSGGLSKSSSAVSPTDGGLSKPSSAVSQTGGGFSQSSSAVSLTGGGLSKSSSAVSQTGGGLSQSSSAVSLTGGGLSKSRSAVSQTDGGLPKSSSAVSLTGGDLSKSSSAGSLTGWGLSKPSSAVSQTSKDLSSIDLSQINSALLQGDSSFTVFLRQAQEAMNHIAFPEDLQLGQFDAMFIYCEDDERDVLKLTKLLEKFITLKNKEKPSFYCHTRRRDLVQTGSRFKSMDQALERSTYMFMYMTKAFVEDSWGDMQKDQCLIESLENLDKHWCVVPLHTRPKRDLNFRMPFGLRALRGVDVYRMLAGTKLADVDVASVTESDFDEYFLSNMKAMLDERLGLKLERQRRLDYRRLEYLMEVTELRRREEREAAHRANIQAIEQQRRLRHDAEQFRAHEAAERRKPVEPAPVTLPPPRPAGAGAAAGAAVDPAAARQLEGMMRDNPALLQQMLQGGTSSVQVYNFPHAENVVIGQGAAQTVTRHGNAQPQPQYPMGPLDAAVDDAEYTLEEVGDIQLEDEEFEIISASPELSPTRGGGGFDPDLCRDPPRLTHTVPPYGHDSRDLDTPHDVPYSRTAPRQDELARGVKFNPQSTMSWDAAGPPSIFTQAARGLGVVGPLVTSDDSMTYAKTRVEGSRVPPSPPSPSPPPPLPHPRLSPAADYLGVALRGQTENTTHPGPAPQHPASHPHGNDSTQVLKVAATRREARDAYDSRDASPLRHGNDSTDILKLVGAPDRQTAAPAGGPVLGVASTGTPLPPASYPRGNDSTEIMKLYADHERVGALDVNNPYDSRAAAFQVTADIPPPMRDIPPPMRRDPTGPR